MELIELKADIRESSGNGPARVLRREGRIPAILYGPGKDSVKLSVSVSDLEKIIKERTKGHVFIDLVIGGEKKAKKQAMIKELQTNPATRDLLHVDFYEISMDRKIRVKVPVVVVGKAKGVEFGGMLQIISRELEVLCLPGEIPEMFEIDVTNLNIGDSIHVKEIPLPANIEIPAEVNFTVLTVVRPKIEEVPVEAAAPVEGEVGAEEGAEAAGEKASEEDEG